MQQNFMSLSISEADMDAINNAIIVLSEKLGPHLHDLSSGEQRDLPRISDKTLSFVQKSLEFCTRNRELVPPFVDLDEFTRDLRAVETLWVLHQPIRRIHEALENSQTLLGSDAYSAALMFYQSVKMAQRSNAPGARAIYEELSGHFPGHTHNVDEDVVSR